MVKHIVMFQLTNQAKSIGTDIVIQRLRSSILSMNGNIPGLIKAELWNNNIGGTHDIALYCEFEQVEDIKTFQNHPIHLAHKKMAMDLVCNRVTLDYKE